MPQDTIWTNANDTYIFIQDSNAVTIKNDSLIIEKLLILDSLDNTTVYAYNAKNNHHTDSLMQVVIQRSKNNIITDFDIQKKKYDELGNFLEVLILLAAVGLCLYAYKRAKRKANNPFDEDERDWVEIGSTTRNNTGSFYDLGSGLQKQPPVQVREYLLYNGSDLNFSNEQIVVVLIKRFPYFNKLNSFERTRFLNRHKKFMKSKSFKIHASSGFKEMPILISATAIQLSFGLEAYMLPFYKSIHIYPEEFLGVHPTIRFLEGNVSGDTINISWKHYLQGYENSSNGQNVGLHEMAHAYYCQNIICEQDRDQSFLKSYNNFHTHGDIVFKIEQEKGQRLYTDYALKNLQEFWAESVEIFFERPAIMKDQYPDLYNCMQLILNQSTA